MNPAIPLTFVSFPTRRSSDLLEPRRGLGLAVHRHQLAIALRRGRAHRHTRAPALDRAHREFEGERLARRRGARSEEHTSELQSQSNLVCRLLLEKKK